MKAETTDKPIFSDPSPELGRDMWAMREALSQVPKIKTDHFHEVSVHRIADLAGFDTTVPEWKLRVMITLAALSDRGDYQIAPLTTDPEIRLVYIRDLDNEHRDGQPYPELFRPIMFADDVKAVCAMVQGGKRGIVALKGLKLQNLTTWCNRGLQRRAADREHLLSIVSNYARTGVPLIADHWSLDDFVRAQEQVRLKNREIAEQAEEAGLALWEAEQTPDRVEPEGEATVTADTKTLCDRCGREPRKEGRPVCINCEEALISQAGFGVVKPVDSRWRSEVEATVARAVAAQLDTDDEDTKAQEAGAIAEDLHAAEEKLKKLGLTLDDAGIFVDGYNHDDEGADEPERAVRASRRQDGRVCVAGMEFAPEQVRATADRISETCADLREIADTLVQTVGETPELHSALGRDNRRAMLKLLKLAHQQAALTLELREYFEEEDIDIRLDRSTSKREG